VLITLETTCPPALLCLPALFVLAGCGGEEKKAKLDRAHLDKAHGPLKVNITPSGAEGRTVEAEPTAADTGTIRAIRG